MGQIAKSYLLYRARSRPSRQNASAAPFEPPLGTRVCANIFFCSGPYLDADGGLVVVRPLVQHLHAVLLGDDWRRQVNGNHLEQGLAGRQPRAHHHLQQRLAVLVLVLVLQLDAQLVQQRARLLLLKVHDAVEDLVDRVEDVHAERALVVILLLLGPLLGLAVEEVLAPQPVHQLDDVDLEPLRVHLGELLEREGPAVQAGAETDRALARIDLGNTHKPPSKKTNAPRSAADALNYPDFAHGAAVVRVGGDDDVDVLNDALEGLVELLGVELELEERPVHLVHEQDGLDALGDRLTQHGLGLDAHTWGAPDQTVRRVSFSTSKASDAKRGTQK